MKFEDRDFFSKEKKKKSFVGIKYI